MKILLLFVPILFLFACTDQQAEIDQLEAEVIKIHDEVMPKNIEINRVRRLLKDFDRDSTLTEMEVKSLNDQILELTKAEESMNDWMVGYKAPAKGDAFEKTMDYLNKEKVKITEVKRLMLTSLKNGIKLLDKFSIRAEEIK